MKRATFVGMTLLAAVSACKKAQAFEQGCARLASTRIAPVRRAVVPPVR